MFLLRFLLLDQSLHKDFQKIRTEISILYVKENLVMFRGRGEGGDGVMVCITFFRELCFHYERYTLSETR